MPAGVKPPQCVGKKGRSGRKTVGEEVIKIVKEKTYAEVFRELIPDMLLATKNLEGLDATKQQGVGGLAIGVKDGKIDAVGHSDTIVPDFATRAKYLDMAYKVTGKYPKEGGTAIQINLNGLKEQYE